MTRPLDFRLSTDMDLRALADLRWRLKSDDEPVVDATAYDGFVHEFVSMCRSDPRRGELFHWVAADGDKGVAAMSVVIVRKVPEPGDLNGRWGYLTNCYALPEARNRGVGTSLLASVKRWADDEHLELLVVWPSDRAYPFYERSGFARLVDPLVLGLT
jgi:GNAT superfamily N-acetyltransferase